MCASGLGSLRSLRKGVGRSILVLAHLSSMPEPNELLQNYESRIYELQQLIEISKSLNGILEYHDLIEAILTSTLGYMKAVVGGVFVQDSLHTTELKLHRSIEGITPEHVRAYVIGVDHPIFEYLLRVQQAVSFDELLEGTGCSRDALFPVSEFEPAAVTPLIAREELKGVLFVGPPVTGEELMPVNREYLSTVGILGGVAVHNALLYEAATTDRLTGLKQRHVFDEMLLHHCKQPARGSQVVSILMLDLDRFKSINDTYGHGVGDRVLKSVTASILSCLRRTDVAARYGGEEFIVLLTDVDTQVAKRIAERIRRSVETSRIPGVDETITISIGISQYSSDVDRNPEAAVARADDALYRAKSEGRNRIACA